MIDRKTKLKLRVWEPLPADPELEELRQRNAKRVAAARAKLGNRHILHPENEGVDWGIKAK